MTSLPQSERFAKNNFDLLRFLFAATVCLVHCYQLSGLQELSWIVTVLSSEVAVKAFFVVSGFLIFMSFERSSSVTSYLGKRIRRIYPAYFVVVMLCATGLILFSSKEPADYFSAVWIKYLLSNLVFMNFIQPTLPGVFDTNMLKAVNGALWTLKIEVMFYLSVPFFVYLFRKFSRFYTLLFTYCLSVVYATLLIALAQDTGSGIYAELARQLPGQLSYFVSGAFLYYFLPVFERHVGLFLMGACLVLVGNSFHSLPFFEPFALATVVVFAGLFLHAGNFGKYGDFSYGLYILHFPVIQLLISASWLKESPVYFLMAVLTVTLLASIAMWHLIEKRFLLRNSHYVAASSVEAGRGQVC